MLLRAIEEKKSLSPVPVPCQTFVDSATDTRALYISTALHLHSTSSTPSSAPPVNALSSVFPNRWPTGNAGEGEWRQVCWEFKQRPRRSEAAVRALLSSAIYTTCVGTDLLFENEYCRAWDFYLPPGGGDAGEPHHHVLDYAFVYVAKGRLLGARSDGAAGLVREWRLLHACRCGQARTTTARPASSTRSTRMAT